MILYDPPHRVVLAWQLDQDWKYDPGLVTELEVRFIADGALTRVELEHRNLDRFGDKAEETRRSLASPGGWTGALELFAAEAERAA